jgi:hypothetical protein
MSFQIRRTHQKYDAIISKSPDFPRIGSLNPFLVWRGDTNCSRIHTTRGTLRNPGACPVCTCQIWHQIQLSILWWCRLRYAVSRERTLKEFYERLQPFGQVFMSLFERADLPSRYALSRYLAALDKPCVEALRTLFQENLGACGELAQGGLYDREGKRWVVVDVDARHRSRTATRLASWSRFASCPSSDGCGMCTGLSRA